MDTRVHTAGTPIAVPVDVISSVCRRWPARGAAWSAAVLGEFHRWCSRIGATAERVFPARYGFVVAVTTSSGPFVLRSTPDPAGRHQAAAAKAWGEIGAGPAIHAVRTTESGTWMLMDRVHPGVPLRSLGAISDAALRALAVTLAAARNRPAPPTNLVTVSDWLRERLLDDDLVDIPPGQQIAHPQVRRDSLAILGELESSAPAAALCHADPNFGNVLVGSNGQPVLVDPRGVRGETAFDLAVVALKAAKHRRLPPRAATRIAGELAGEVGEDPERARAWVTVAVGASL